MSEEAKAVPDRKLSPGKTRAADNLDIRGVFEDQLFYDLFNGRCHDINEKPTCIPND